MKCMTILMAALAVPVTGANEASAEVPAEATAAGSSEIRQLAANEAVRFADPVELSASAGKRLIIVAVPSLSFQELEPERLERMPHLRRMIAGGALGAMNLRTPERGVDDAYLTLGAGAPAIIRKAAPPLNRGEAWNSVTAEDLYVRFHGRPPEQADVLLPAFQPVRELNEKLHYGARPGMLGQWLRDQGIARYVFGNSDRGLAQATAQTTAERGAEQPDMWHRHAAWLLADEAGTVSGGDVGTGTLAADASRPFGVKTDYSALLERIRAIRASGPGNVIVAELGDLNRLYADRGSYGAARFEELKDTVLDEMDAFLGGLMADLGPEDALWLFSPMPNEEAAARKMLLVPWVMFPIEGDAMASNRSGAILHSASTRQPGIVAHVDFAPTVMGFFAGSGEMGEAVREAAGKGPGAGDGVVEAARFIRHITLPGGLHGFPVQPAADEGGVQELMRRLDHIFAVHRLRPKLLYPFVSYEIGVLLISLLFALAGWTRGSAWLRRLLFSILLAPIVFLLVGYVRADEAIMAVLFVIGLAASTFLAAALPLMPALAAVSGVSSALLLADGILLDSAGMKRSILGYDVMYGARYYGIGNEFMGVLAAGAILFAAVCLHLYGKRRRWNVADKETSADKTTADKAAAGAIVALFFLGIMVYMGAPNLGTNAGGLITVVIAFGLAWLRWFTGFASVQQIRWGKLLAIVAVLGLLSLIGLWLLNAAFPAVLGAESHIGRAFRLLMDGRLEEIGEIIRRKLNMNWRLIGISAWSKVFVTSLFVIAVLLFRPKGVFRRWQESMPAIMYGCSAIALGAIIALLVNDSGIVSAAIMIEHAAVPMLLFKLDR
jgi:hypothetical protein